MHHGHVLINTSQWCHVMCSPLLQTVIENGVVRACYKDNIKPSLRKETAAVVLHDNTTFTHLLLQLVNHLTMTSNKTDTTRKTDLAQRIFKYANRQPGLMLQRRGDRARGKWECSESRQRYQVFIYCMLTQGYIDDGMITIMFLVQPRKSREPRNHVNNHLIYIYIVKFWV